MNKMTAEDKRWRAESDARVLMSATEIESEKSRLNDALKELDKIATDAEKVVKRIKIVKKEKSSTKKSKPKKAAKKSTKKRK